MKKQTVYLIILIVSVAIFIGLISIILIKFRANSTKNSAAEEYSTSEKPNANENLRKSKCILEDFALLGLDEEFKKISKAVESKICKHGEEIKLTKREIPLKCHDIMDTIPQGIYKEEEKVTDTDIRLKSFFAEKEIIFDSSFIINISNLRLKRDSYAIFYVYYGRKSVTEIIEFYPCLAFILGEKHCYVFFSYDEKDEINGIYLAFNRSFHDYFNKK